MMDTLDMIAIASLLCIVCSILAMGFWPILANDMNKAIYGFRGLSFSLLVFYSTLVAPFLLEEGKYTFDNFFRAITLLVMGVIILKMAEACVFARPTGKPEPLDLPRDLY